MAVFEDLLEGGATPVALGVGAIVLAPTLLPVIGRIIRPIAKGAIKTGMAIYQETYAAVAEATGDLVAEARAELESEAREGTSKAPPPHHRPAGATS